MPSTPLYVSPALSSATNSQTPSPLPSLLQTPGGLAIFEIQGSLHTPAAAIEGDGSASGITNVGKLVFPLYDPVAPADDESWMRKVHLYVGRHQRLTGEVKKLGKGKCIGVVRKVDEMVSEAGQREEGLEIVDVVKYKILFKGRPEPVDMVMDG